MDLLLTYASLISPIIGTIAIIVALVIGHRSSKDVNKLIAKVSIVLAVLIASQYSAKEYYYKQVKIIDDDINKVESMRSITPVGSKVWKRLNKRLEELREQRRSICKIADLFQ